MTLTLKFDLLLKNFNLSHNLPTRSGLSYCTCLFLVTRPFTWHHDFDLVTLTLKFDLLLKNLNLSCYLVMVAALRTSLSSDNSYYLGTLTLQADLLLKKKSWTMTFDSEGLLIVAIYIWLPPASSVVFLTTLVSDGYRPASVIVFWQLLLQDRLYHCRVTPTARFCLISWKCRLEENWLQS